MEFDIEDFDALRHYLTLRGHIESGETVSFKKLCGGVSNRTVRVTWANGQGWAMKQALAKLRVEVDWFSSPDRIGVEAKALRWLNCSAPPGTTPAFIFEDAANYLMAMEAIPEEHENWKSVLLSGQIAPHHFELFGLLLGAIHRKSSEAGAEVCETFADTTYFENLRLDPYYRYTAQKVPVAAKFLNTLAQETLCHKNSLVHGDFSPKNTLLYRGRIDSAGLRSVSLRRPGFRCRVCFDSLPQQSSPLAQTESPSGQRCRTLLAGLQRSDCGSGLGRCGRVAGGTSYSGVLARPRCREISARVFDTTGSSTTVRGCVAAHREPAIQRKRINRKVCSKD